MIFKKIYLTGIVSSWKYFLGYNPTLEMMAELLEADYELELWSEPEFCKKFIELFESFRRLRSFANRDHLGNSLIDDRKRQEEAKPLYQFFDVDYELHPRLLYALQGTEWTGWEEQEVEVEVVEGEQADDELLQGNEMMMGAGADEQQQKESEADQNQLQQRIKKE